MVFLLPLSFIFSTVFLLCCYFTTKIHKYSSILLLANMGEINTKLCDYTNTPNDHFIARPNRNPEIKAGSFEVSHGLLNLIAKDQFGGSASEDDAST
jgi:hypothetical protein